MMLTFKNISPAPFESLKAVGFLCVLTLMLSGCNTPQQKAHNSPTPIPPPPQQTTQKDNSQDTRGGEPQVQTQQQSQAAGDPGAEKSATESQQQQSVDAQNANAADACAPNEQASTPDVEITDVPLDENGNPIEPDVETVATNSQAEQECQTAKNSQQEQQRQAEKQMQNNQAANQQQNQSAGQRASSGNMKTANAQTSEEKLAAANANMDSRLAAFDELMRRAREAAEQQRAAANGGTEGQYGGGYGGQYDGRGGSQQPPKVRGEGGQADTSSGLGHTPDRSGEARPGDYKQVATGPVPANIPDGRDDDIVARQLREAASKETDPVLREKLWEEYKKYKSGIVGR